jgi:hypothetical protein
MKFRCCSQASSRDDHRFAFDGQNRRSAERIHRHLSALVCLHAVGIRRLRLVCHRRAGRDQSVALRFAGRRVGDWSPATSRSIPASSSRSSSLANISACFRLPASPSRSFSADGARRSPSWRFIPSWAWFFAEAAGAIFFFIWLRGTLPRLRQDQLMNFAWKFMLPMSLAQSARRWSMALLRRWLVALGHLQRLSCSRRTCCSAAS